MSGPKAHDHINLTSFLCGPCRTGRLSNQLTLASYYVWTWDIIVAGNESQSIVKCLGSEAKGTAELQSIVYSFLIA